MKRLSLFIVVLVGFNAFSQKMDLDAVNLVGGLNFANFTFKDSQNHKDKQLKYQLYSAFGINVDIKGGRHIIRPEILFRQAGAQTSVNGTHVNWKMNYINVNFNYLVAVFEGKKFSIQPGVGIGIAYMMNGRQDIGENRLNIINEKSMRRFELNAMGVFNATAHLTPSFNLGLEYRFGIGLNQIESDINSQKTRNLYHGIMLNLGFVIHSSSSSRI
jgi:hypothetical protein